MAEARTCEFDDRKHYAKGLCFPHYRKLWKAGYVIGPAQPGRPPKPVTCSRCGDTFKRRRGTLTKRQRTLCRTCIWFRQCRKCNREFDATDTNYFYCEDCRFEDFYDYWKYWAEQNREDLNRKARARNSRRRAAEHGADFTHEDIFNRDNWSNHPRPRQCLRPKSGSHPI